MLVADRYDEYTDTTAYNTTRTGRSSYYRTSAFDNHYEAERRSTSEAERARLMSSLERTGTRSRVERMDEDRYGYFAANYAPATNNYDKMLDRRANRETYTEKKVFNKKKTPFVVAYLIVALVAIIAVTLSVVGVKGTPVVESLESTETAVLSASAESVVESEALSASETVLVQEGGDDYIMLKTGELVAVEVPASAEVTQEEEKGFDKFCSWLNGIFGGD